MSDISSEPWTKTTLSLVRLGAKLRLRVPHDVFSTLCIDEGTLLLLDNLPRTEPASVLDMGCGYGALGLPIAARHPRARLELVDRDLLAVAFATRNAQENGLANTTVFGSLGYRDVVRSARCFDWILCNVPARIGRPFIAHLFEAGRALLAAGGELRVVVIRDLAPVVESLRTEHGWPIAQEARGPRHVVFSLAADERAQATPLAIPDPSALYSLEKVSVAGLELERPTDLGGDDPRRRASALPVLLDALPRQTPRRVLSFRCGYGALPLTARARWPEAQVVAVDRDLLATAFTRLNAQRLGLETERLEVRESAHLPDALRPAERFDLAFGELSASAGPRVAAAELTALASSLDRGGQALVLALEKQERSWVRPLVQKTKLGITRVIQRDGHVVLRLAPG